MPRQVAIDNQQITASQPDKFMKEVKLIGQPDFCQPLGDSFIRISYS